MTESELKRRTEVIDRRDRSDALEELEWETTRRGASFNHDRIYEDLGDNHYDQTTPTGMAGVT